MSEVSTVNGPFRGIVFALPISVLMWAIMAFGIWAVFAS